MTYHVEQRTPEDPNLWLNTWGEIFSTYEEAERALTEVLGFSNALLVREDFRIVPT